jgi:uncharacterized membrane protein
LSRYRLNDRLYSDFAYVTRAQVSGDRWLSQNNQNPNLLVYVDISASLNMVAYGEIYTDNLRLLYNGTLLDKGQFVYLSELNVVYHEVEINSKIYNISETLTSDPLSVIYNNGENEILTKTSP